jgi:hypothetical protein
MAVVMLVRAVRVMIMIVGMIMNCVMVMRVIRMHMVVRGGGIGAALRIERRLDLDQACAEPLHHRFDHVITPDA